MVLKDIAFYVEVSISSDYVELEQYITTDNILQNKEGRSMAANLPPQSCGLTHYLPGDILIANIRPYLKKVWKANIEGGCSKDVLVIRAKENHYSDYLYAITLQDVFFENAMLGNKGTQMPRGDKDKIMEFPVFEHAKEDERKIGDFINKLQNKISLNTRLNAELEAMAKQLYDYWFVQFDFPNENGKPYKSSGGQMVYDEKLKREIPEGWKVKNLYYIANFHNGLACQNYRPLEGEESLPVIKISEMHNGYTPETERATVNIPLEVIIENGDVLFAWSASLEVMLWGLGTGALNQHIFKVTPNNGFPKSFYYYQLLEYVGHFKKIAEAKKTTMGHITKDHLEQSQIIVPPDTDLPNQLEQQLAPIMNKMIAMSTETVYLTHLRDSLLPMLMNGQITIE